jgi:SAM-dependent methyltransferase
VTTSIEEYAMSDKPWHEDDDFWRSMAPFMFSEANWENAPIQVDQLVALLQLAPGSNVLDCPCGPGRHTLELARRGYEVTGVDRTAAYLDEARRLAEAENLAPELILADMRQFCRPETYDVALSLFTSFGYFERPAENELVLRNYWSSLKPGGVLVIEMSGKEIIARIYQQRDWREHEGALLLEERNVAADWRRMESRWLLVKDGNIKEKRFSHWLYSAGELGQLLTNSGFQRIEFYGDMEGAAYDHEAKRLIAVAHK